MLGNDCSLTNWKIEKLPFAKSIGHIFSHSNLNMVFKDSTEKLSSVVSSFSFFLGSGS